MISDQTTKLRICRVAGQRGLNCRNVIMFPQVSDNDVQDLRKISGQGKPGILFKCLAQWLDRI